MNTPTSHSNAMPEEEVLRVAEAFDPTPAERFISWAKQVDPDMPPACPCNGCAAISREVRSAKIMRLAIQMIMQTCDGANGSPAIDRIRSTAETALRECSIS